MSYIKENNSNKTVPKDKYIRIAGLFYDVTYPKGISSLVTTNPAENPARAATIKPA